MTDYFQLVVRQLKMEKAENVGATNVHRNLISSSAKQNKLNGEDEHCIFI